jgi:hypothetical protein
MIRLHDFPCGPVYEGLCQWTTKLGGNDPAVATRNIRRPRNPGFLPQLPTAEEENMNPRITFPVFALIAFLMLGVGQANASFPGENGRIAFVQWPDIFTMNPDGSDVRQLTNLGPDRFAFWESWSPDGKQIVFNESSSADFRFELWLMNADGSNQHVLLAEPVHGAALNVAGNRLNAPRSLVQDDVACR